MATHQDMGDFDYSRAINYVCLLGKTVRVPGDVARQAPVSLKPDVCPCCGRTSLIVKRERGERGHDALILRCEHSGSERLLRATTPPSLDD